MQVFGPKELQSDVLQKNLCAGCGACVSLCPYFKTHKGRTAAMFQCTRESGRCSAYCPKTGVDLDRLSATVFNGTYAGDAIGNFKAVYVSQKGSSAGNGNVQNGGTVSALMQFALKSGAVDSAVLTGRKGAVSVPEIVTDPGKVFSYASSKYSTSPVVAGFNKAAAEGYAKIGFVGTPCAVTAMAKIRSNPTELADFSDKTGIVVGLFCTWALDTWGVEKTLKDKLDLASLQRVDIPPPPADVMTFTNIHKDVMLPLDEIRASIPLACAYCHDMTAEFADISVGALEIDGGKNRNVIIIRTDRGEKLYKDAVAAGYITGEPLPAGVMDGLSKASMNKKIRAFTRLSDEKMLNGDAERPAVIINAPALGKIMNSKGGM
ncbi:MAG TPA: Coenzyme F420 hydrogenase/dehydrogenase, beta subunit C-terminal domain [Spirochaetota bacterium]|nr:Coenzyme F420 hydrogenase/dehydrogenase, beta subunit C-terminal domain [Spirochaetota bacterium]